MLTVRLSEELENRLNEIVQKSGESKSAFTRDAIANFLTRWERDTIADKQTYGTDLSIE
jgi:predicted transcriptional regulator